MIDDGETNTLQWVVLLGAALATLAFFMWARLKGLAVTKDTALDASAAALLQQHAQESAAPTPAKRPASQQRPHSTSTKSSKHPPRPTHPLFFCQLKGHTDTVNYLDFSDSFLASVGNDRMIRLWDLKSFQRKESGFVPKVSKVEHVGDNPVAVAVSPDSRRIATATYNTQTVRLYGPDSFTSTNTTTNPSYKEYPQHHKMDIICLGLGKDYIMSCSSDTTMNFWRTDSETLIEEVRTNAVNNYTARISPDGVYTALGGFVSDVKAFTVNLSAKKAVSKGFSLNGHKRGVQSVSFSGDSKKMLTLSKDGTCKLWNVDVRHHLSEDAKVLRILDIRDQDQAELSPDGKLIAFVKESTIKIWSLEKDQYIETIEDAHQAGIKMVRWSRDGRFLASISVFGREIHVWDMPPHATDAAIDEPVRRRNILKQDSTAAQEEASALKLDTSKKLDHFFWANEDEPHATRRREMLRKYPQIRNLMRHEPITKYIVTAEVALQFFLAWALKDRLWTPEFWLTAYFVGGTITSALVLSIHEITHFLAFKTFLPNKILACIANLPIVLPFCVEFKRFHMDHHRFQGLDGVDGDLPTELEAKLFNSTLGKLFFCSTQIIFYALRPKLVATPRTYQIPKTLLGWMFSWYSMNYAIQISVIAATIYFWGINPVIYLAVSVLLGGSLHPMAGHFLAEHYVTAPGQETYSYYGPLNILAFNVGYHNEHHDFPNIPWTLLPELRKIAPEYYDTLPQCKSWTWTIINFITTPGYGPYSRIKRKTDKVIKEKVVAEQHLPREDDVDSPAFVGKEDS
ncbi:hypothetical protein HDV05_001621 [Chytridiales sp. JEL 0842]|nr:hypothetical protein HDV05_001621 [Chytridiales sp. JEL 0842]